MNVEVFRGRAALGRALRAPAVAVGNFDGVHLGHRALMDAARRLAAPRGGDVVALTFDPHPARLFAPTLAPPLIVPLQRRIELLGEAGATVVVVEPFTREFASLDAETFVRRVLCADLGARDVVVGYDFSFGRDRLGRAPLLERLGKELGVGVTVVPAVQVEGLTSSSTKIREFVLEGRVEGAAMLLGRPFEIVGEVVRGAARGRTLGFPTANIRPEGELLPKGGIYAARTRIDGEPARAPVPTALSIGTNPTFESGGALTVEAHLIDFDGNLYGRRLTLELGRRLRDERRFPDVDALVAQIKEDVSDARRPW